MNTENTPEISAERFDSPQIFSAVFARLKEMALKDQAEFEILIDCSDSFNANFQHGKLDKFQSRNGQCAGFRVIKSGKTGYAYTENFSPDSIYATYREALSNTNYQAADPDQTLELHINKNPMPFLDPCPGYETPVQEKLQRAKVLEAGSLETDSRIVACPHSSYSESLSSRRVINSKGTDLNYQERNATAFAYPLAKSEHMNFTSWKVDWQRDPKKIDAKKLGHEAALEALSKFDAEIPASGEYPVVLQANVVSTLLEHLAEHLTAKSVFEKRSLFEKMLGQKVASSQLEITDDPFYVIGMASRPFDAEGTPSQKTVLIENGELKNFLSNSVYAKKMQIPNTAHASRSPRSELEISHSNLIVKEGGHSLQDLLVKFAKDGAGPHQVILITEFDGVHGGLDESSGNFSLQSQGVLYVDGQRKHALRDFVTSGNLLTILGDIIAIGQHPKQIESSVVAPDILIGKLSIAGA